MNYKSKQFRNLLHRVTMTEAVDPLERKKKLLKKKQAGIKLTPKEEEELERLGKTTLQSSLSGMNGAEKSLKDKLGKNMNIAQKVMDRITGEK